LVLQCQKRVDSMIIATPIASQLKPRKTKWTTPPNKSLSS
jgi:hypothetical protein